MISETRLPETVRLVVAVSADGYIDERPVHERWNSPEDWDHFQSKLAQAGAIIMGRGTYQVNKDRMVIDPKKPRIVRTHTPERYQGERGLEFTDMYPRQILRNLAARGINEVVVVGGVKVYQAFLRRNLVTDMYVTREPVVINGSVRMPDNFTQPFGHWIQSTLLNKRGTRLEYYKKHGQVPDL